MTRFDRQPERSDRELVEDALAEALCDAGTAIGEVQAVYMGNAVAGLMSGKECVRAQIILRRTGLMGVPMINVESADASSAAALHLAWQDVACGAHDCAVVIGYEKLHYQHQDRSRPYSALNASMDLAEVRKVDPSLVAEGRTPFMDWYGAVSGGAGGDLYSAESLALVTVKNNLHSSLNPRALRQRALTIEEVLASRQVAGPLTRMMCASLTDGAACLVLTASPSGRRDRAAGVRIAASVLLSGRGDDLRQPACVAEAANRAYEAAGVGPEDLDVVELFDATAVGELLVYGRLGLCRPEDAERLLRKRVTWLGGSRPVNPSGGMLGRGHAIGATGAAQVVELTWQLQGRCGSRQVPGARVGLAQCQGGWVGSDVAASAVHILQA